MTTRGQHIFDGGDTSGVFAADHVGDLLWQMERFLFNDLRILDDIYSDIKSIMGGNKTRS